MKTGQKTRNLFIKKKQKKTNKKKSDEREMRDLQQKRAQKIARRLKKGDVARSSDEIFSLSSLKNHEKVPFFGTFLGAFRGADFSRRRVGKTSLYFQDTTRVTTTTTTPRRTRI